MEDGECVGGLCCFCGFILFLLEEFDVWYEMFIVIVYDYCLCYFMDEIF